MKLEEVARAYITTVEGLINQPLPNGGKLYIETNKGQQINFRPKDFRLKLQSVVGETKNINVYLGYFKRLGWIITSGDLFSCTQRYKKKVHRVIAINRNRFETITELMG